MENIITTAAGENYEMAVVRNYMDDELCEAIHGTVDTEGILRRILPPTRREIRRNVCFRACKSANLKQQRRPI